MFFCFLRSGVGRSRPAKKTLARVYRVQYKHLYDAVSRENSCHKTSFRQTKSGTMEKEKRTAKGKMHVSGQRAAKYRIWRHGDTDEDPPVPLENFEQARVEAGAVAWVRPTNGITEPVGVVDTKRAIAGLLECDTDFRFWLEARDMKYVLALTEQKWSPRMMRGMRGLSMQNARRQRRFENRLRAWVNKFGPLDRDGTGEDYVDVIMQSAHALRAWATRDLSLPDRLWSAGTFALRVDDYAPDVNAAAGKCARDPETGAWEAPTLWSAMCHSIQHASDYGWTFVECEADDCFNVFLKKRTEHVTCSQRCGKRMRRKASQSQQ